MKKTKVILLILLLIVLLFSILNIIKNFQEDMAAKEIMEELIELIDIPDVPSEEPKFQVNFNELKKINSDVVGWIVIEGTQINYPIVRGSNNTFYLNHSYDKTWNSYGSIFMDYESSSDFSSYNTFIYGHHTRNGSMFGELYKYMDAEYYENHKLFYLYTPKSNYEAQIFSAYVDSTTSDSYNQFFSSEKEYAKYIKMIKDKSNYETDVNVDFSRDKIITLYSCSHESSRQKTDRYFIHAVLKNVDSL